MGSTFTINDQTYTVAGLFDAGTAFGNNALLHHPSPRPRPWPRCPASRLSTMIVTVNSMENVDAAKTALQAALGTDKADVTPGPAQPADRRQLAGQRQEHLVFIAFVAALGNVPGLIILLIMVMLVRERRREIGVS